MTPHALLVDGLVKASLLLLLAGGAALALRQASAAARHLVWAVALSGLVVLPVASLVAPRWRLPVPAGLVRASEVVGGRLGSGDRAAIAAPASWDGTPGIAVARPDPSPALPASGTVEMTGGVRPELVRAPAPGDAGVARHGQGARAVRLRSWLVLVWLAGAMGILGAVVAGLFRAHRLARHAVQVRDGRLARLAREIAARLGVTRPVRVLRAAGQAMPMTWGVRRPVLLLPAAATAWPEARLRAVLLHELAHVKRLDYVTHAIARCACALYWFHPLVWLAARRLRVERELACDDVVLAAGSRPSEYAGHLLEIARSFRAGRLVSVAGIAMARPTQLAGRLLAVLDARRTRATVTHRAVVPAGILAACVLISLAGATAGAGAPGRQQRPERVRSLEPPAQRAAAVAERSVRTAGTVPAAVQECDWAAARDVAASYSVNDGDVHIRIRVGECRLELDAAGAIAFRDDDGDVVSISPGGYFDIEERRGRETRRLEITPVGGALQRRWVVNGEVRWTVTGDIASHDPSTGAWLARVLPVVFRRTGYQAERRAERILAQRGVEGVLEEAALVLSDHAARQYFAVLLARGDLTPQEIRQVVQLAGRQIDSDFELAELLIAVAREQPVDELVRAAYVEAAATINSDFEQRRALAAVLQREGLSQGVAAAMLQSATAIDSDFELAELLVEVLRARPLDEVLTPGFFAAVRTMESDFERRRVLAAALEAGAPQPAVLDRALETAAEIESDFELAELLIQVAGLYPVDRALPPSFVAAAGTLESDFEQGRVWGALLERDALAPDALSAVLEAVAGVDSDFEKANLLARVAGRYALDARTRPAFFGAAGSLDSDFEHARVLAAVLEAPGLDAATVAAVLESCLGLESDFEAATLLVVVAGAYRIDDSLRAAFLRVADTIESEYERGRSLAALYPRGR